MAYKFTRSIYKRIKKYDKEDMEEFVQSVYLKGFNDANRNTDKGKIEVKEKLESVKGLGDKTIDKVLMLYLINLRWQIWRKSS